MSDQKSKLTAEQLIKLLDKVGLTPNVAHYEYTEEPVKYEPEHEEIYRLIGEYTEEENGVYSASYYTGSEARVTLHFKEHDIYLKGSCYHNSYGDNDLGEWRHVVPVEIVSIEYEDVK